MTNAANIRALHAADPTLTQSAIARACGVSRQAVQSALRAQSGKRGPRTRAVRCEACGALPCHQIKGDK